MTDPLDRFRGFSRITVIGPPGAGKSTLARQLGQQLELPVHHLDSLFWRPGWVMAPRHEYVAAVEELVARDRWVMDGNYTSTLPQRLARADAVAFLLPNRWRSVYRVIRRIVQFHRTSRPDMPEGCPERFSWEFIRYTWRWEKDEMPETMAILAQFKGPILPVYSGPASAFRTAARPSR